jgi:hypothetical protein
LNSNTNFDDPLFARFQRLSASIGRFLRFFISSASIWPSAKIPSCARLTTLIQPQQSTEGSTHEGCAIGPHRIAMSDQHALDRPECGELALMGCSDVDRCEPTKIGQCG